MGLQQNISTKKGSLRLKILFVLVYVTIYVKDQFEYKTWKLPLHEVKEG